MSIIHPALTAGIIHLLNLALPNQTVKEKAKIYFLYVIHSLQRMSIGWVWALRAIRVLKLVAHRWLPQEHADLFGHASVDVSNRETSTQKVSPGLASLPDVQDHDQSWDDLLQQAFDASWLEGTLFQSELSFSNLGQWPGI